MGGGAGVPSLLSPVVFLQLLKEQDRNHALSKQAVLQPRVKGAHGAVWKGREWRVYPPHAGKKLDNPPTLPPPRQKKPTKPLKSFSHAFCVYMETSIFFDTSCGGGGGFTPRG